MEKVAQNLVQAISQIVTENQQMRTAQEEVLAKIMEGEERQEKERFFSWLGKGGKPFVKTICICNVALYFWIGYLLFGMFKSLN